MQHQHEGVREFWVARGVIFIATSPIDPGEAEAAVLLRLNSYDFESVNITGKFLDYFAADKCEFS